MRLAAALALLACCSPPMSDASTAPDPRGAIEGSWLVPAGAGQNDEAYTFERDGGYRHDVWSGAEDQVDEGAFALDVDAWLLTVTPAASSCEGGAPAAMGSFQVEGGVLTLGIHGPQQIETLFRLDAGPDLRGALTGCFVGTSFTPQAVGPVSP